MAYTVYDTIGIVTDSWPYKEASRRLSVYSRDIGRILVRAQSVRKLDSKLQPATQLYAESQFELVYGKSGWRLVGTNPERNFYFATNYQQQSAIARVTRLLTRLTPGRRSNSGLYTIVTSGLKALKESGSKQKAHLIEKLLVLRMVALLGYAPDPSATQLQPFVHTSGFDDNTLTEFADEEQAAVKQINQALANTQL